MESIFSFLTPYLPDECNFEAVIGIIALFTIGSLILGFLGRFFLGKRSALNHIVTSAIGIVVIYAVTIAIYTFNPLELRSFLTPLPFVTFNENVVSIFCFSGAAFTEISTQILNLLILAFLTNLLDYFIPEGKNIFSWYLCRFITVALSMFLQLLISGLLATFLPNVLTTHAPAILVGILLLMLLLSALKVVLSLALATVNPILGAICGFFFSSVVGKMITKAAITTSLLCALVFALEQVGYAKLYIAAAALPAYSPFCLVLLALWYVLGHLL